MSDGEVCVATALVDVIESEEADEAKEREETDAIELEDVLWGEVVAEGINVASDGGNVVCPEVSTAQAPAKTMSTPT